MRAFFRSILCGVVLCGSVYAQGGPGAGGAEREGAGGLLPGSRVLRTFDFEERKLGNFESVPMYWSKVAGRGFPAYSSGVFDYAGKGKVRSGEASFKLETSGGSVAFRLTPPAEKRIPVHADADYYILAFARTRGLKHARADVAAWFADEAGNLLAGTEVHSQAYVPGGAAAGGDEDAWRVLYIYVPGPKAGAGGSGGDGGAARSLVLQLGLMQPQQLGMGEKGAGAGSGLGRFEIYQQDIEGAVWFDDIVVFQLPRVSVSVPAGAVGNLFVGGQRVELDLVVSDLGEGQGGRSTTGRPLDVRLKITNGEGLVLAAERYAATTAPDRAWRHRYTRAPLPAGMYTATLDIMDSAVGAGGASGGLIARRETQFLCLPAAAGVERPAAEFGLGFDTEALRNGGDGGAWMLEAAPTLLKHSGAGLVQLPAWRREMTEDALTRRDAPFDALLATLQRQDIRTIGTFSAIPGTLSKRLPVRAGAEGRPDGDRDSILALLNADPAVWRPYLSFSLTRYANRIDRWQLGAPDMPFSGGETALGPDTTDQYARLYERAFGEITSLLNQRQLIIPWNALFEFDARQYPHALLDLRLPAVIKPGQIPAYIDNFRQALAGGGAGGPAGEKGLPLFAHLEALEAGAVSPGERLADFAQRVVWARTAGPQSILFDVGGKGAGGGPDELFLVYRTMIRALGNSKYVGELPLGGGLRAFLFDRHGSGTLILWNEAGVAAEVPVALPLGATSRLVDLVGNPQPVALDAATGLTHVTVTGTPLIFDQLDPRPLQLKTSYALGTATMPAGAGSVRTEVVLTNPYADTLSGSLRIMPPKGWTADPATMRLAVPAGQTFRQAVTIRYPFTENSGRKVVDGRLSLEQSATLNAQQMEMSFPVTVSSDRVEMEGFTQMLENGDIVVQQMVTNISDKPLDAQAYVLLPGYPRQQRYVSGLPAGQTAIKRFTFSAGSYVGTGSAPGERVTAETLALVLKGQAATMGLRQNDGKTLLTKTVPLE